MKRKIALLLAVVMILSLVPMMSFAASDNSINRVPQVAKNAKFDNASTAPQLRVEEKRANEFGAKETFRLNLEGAEWLEDELEAYSGTEGIYFESILEKRVTVVVYRSEAKGSPSATDKAAFTIPMLAKVTDNGEAKVTIDSRGSSVTGGTYVFANAASGSTVTTVDGTVTFAQEKTELKTIEIDETKLGGFKDDNKVRFILPRDFVWGDTAAQVKDKMSFLGGYSTYSKANVTVEFSSDKEEMIMTFKNLPNTTSTARGTIVFTDLGIEAKRNAKLGDVTLRVRGDAENQELVVAKYVDYDVIIEADDDPTEIFAGRLDGKTEEARLNETHELQKLIIKEEVAGAWILDRKVVVEFPSFVKVIGAEVKKSDKLDVDEDSFTFDENVVEFIATEDNDGKEKANLEVIFYVSVEADASGDITATVSGRGLPAEEEVVLGKALAPVEVKVDVKDVKLGVQRQDLGTITLSEVKEGGVVKGIVRLELEDGFRWASVPTVKVTEGDIRIDERSAKVNREVLTFEVTRSSDKASVIEITNAEVDLYRTLPEGDFKMYVGGDALVQNYDPAAKAEDATFRTQWVDEVAVAKVVTPAPGGETRQPVSLTIGQIPAGGDAAPYVKNNRTYAPVSAVAQALGINKNNIIWNAEARTVTILGEKTVQMSIGSTTLLVNGTPVVMDAAPEITSSRTFLPIAWLAKALDVEYSWDAATQTVTFY